MQTKGAVATGGGISLAVLMSVAAGIERHVSAYKGTLNRRMNTIEMTQMGFDLQVEKLKLKIGEERDHQ